MTCVGRATRSGRCVACKTRSVTLPMTQRPSPPRPCVAIAITSLGGQCEACSVPSPSSNPASATVKMAWAMSVPWTAAQVTESAQPGAISLASRWTCSAVAHRYSSASPNIVVSASVSAMWLSPEIPLLAEMLIRELLTQGNAESATLQCAVRGGA